ncbi:nucleotidyltransferase family protein [Tropicimonas sp. S265A]|uniref:nucleotidyltransferase family protein n=1 Tax=Tropicimonas sp. S265A TaxID=3415134 RepID=UPI003C7B1700
MTDRIVILAAGQSTRMRGADKLLEDVAGQPVLRRLAITALSLGWPVHVALPAADHPRTKALEGLEVEVHAVPEAAEGMGATLREMARNLGADTSGLLVMLGDMPDIDTQDLARLVAARDAQPDAAIWRAATRDGAPGHPILFAGETLPAFDRLSGDDGGRAVVKAFADRVHLVPLPGVRARLDLDTPEDWARWRASQQQQ